MKITIEIDNKYVDGLAAMFKMKVKGTEEDYKEFDDVVERIKEDHQTMTADEDLSIAIVACVLSNELEKKKKGRMSRYHFEYGNCAFSVETKKDLQGWIHGYSAKHGPNYISSPITGRNSEYFKTQAEAEVDAYKKILSFFKEPHFGADNSVNKLRVPGSVLSTIKAKINFQQFIIDINKVLQ